jgi:methylated-DNA-[protein]-cysteine S-methyltransferase
VTEGERITYDVGMTTNRTTRETVTVPAGALGSVRLTAQHDRLAAIDILPGETAAPADPTTPVLALAAAQLAEYFAGRRRVFELPLAPAANAFQARVREAMLAIPFGAVGSYGGIAAMIGSGPRAIGGACGRNPLPIVVPCHRVLGAGGRAGGYSGIGGLETKRFLLALEGVTLPNH